jgi:hypothetical protein
MAKLSDYPTLGFFPQSTSFTLTVSLAKIDNLISVLNSNGEIFDYIQYQIIIDGVKETQFLITQPEQNQKYQWSPVYYLESASLFIP